MVLEHPELPLTNNLAERALRHWVIARRISYGTRNPQGSRAFTILARLIETCRQRGLWHGPTLPRRYVNVGKATQPQPSACRGLGIGSPDLGWLRRGSERLLLTGLAQQTDEIVARFAITIYP
jgi:hypothetical protein